MVRYTRKALFAGLCALGAALVFGGLMRGVPDAQARQVERPVLFVECPASTGSLCQALVRAVAPYAPSAVIRLDAAPAGVQALRIAFHPETVNGAFAGHLSWHVPGGAVRTGPTHQQVGGNVTKSSQSAKQFAEALVKKTPELQSILTASK